MADLKEPIIYSSSSSDDVGPSHGGAAELTEAEKALWRDPEKLARIEAVLDDPSLAVPLEELD